MGLRRSSMTGRGRKMEGGGGPVRGLQAERSCDERALRTLKPVHTLKPVYSLRPVHSPNPKRSSLNPEP